MKLKGLAKTVSKPIITKKEIIVVKDTATKPKHDPRIATRRSLIFPGLGQIYNKQYWKLPLVYGALGTTLGIAFWNNDRYQLWLTNFQTLSKNPNDVTYVPPTEVEVNGQKYNLSNVTVRKDFNPQKTTKNK